MNLYQEYRQKLRTPEEAVEASGDAEECDICGMSILLVEDNADFADFFVRHLAECYTIHCVADGQLWLTPDQDSIRAASDALAGWDPTSGCVYYYNPATATSSWIWSREVRLTIGAHAFAV